MHELDIFLLNEDFFDENDVLRIKNNLMIKTNDIIEYCKNIIVNENNIIYKKGKNYYCETNKEIITINSYNYSIITAHKKGKN